MTSHGFILERRKEERGREKEREERGKGKEREGR